MTKTFNEVPEGFYLLLNFDKDGNQKTDETPEVVKFSTVEVKEKDKPDSTKQVWTLSNGKTISEDPRAYGFSLVPVNDVIALVKKEYHAIQHYN